MRRKTGAYYAIAAVFMAIIASVLVIYPLPAESRMPMILTSIWLFGPAIVGSIIFFRMDQKDEWDPRKPLR